jgi:hypothetical protein
MTIGSSMGIEGHYQFAVVKPDGTTVKPFGDRWHKNIITDAALRHLIGTDPWGAAGIQVCCIGTGNTPPTVNDNALVAQVATKDGSTTSSTYRNPSPPYEYRSTQTWEFSARTGSNVTLAEVGVRAISGDFFSRALIVDVGGSPTTLTLLVGEILVVTYSWSMTPSIADETGTFVINGTTHTWLVRHSQVASVGGPVYNAQTMGWNTGIYASGLFYENCVLGDVTGLPSYSTQASLFRGLTRGPTGSYFADISLTAPIGAANFTNGISGFRFITTNTYGGWCIQGSIDPPVMKTADDIFSFSLRATLTRT